MRIARIFKCPRIVGGGYAAISTTRGRMHTHSDETHATMTPAKALQFLKDGNRRFVANLQYDRGLLPQVNTTGGRQLPIAAVLHCIDARTSAELLFDQALGDLYSVGVGANVLGEDSLGSLEYACSLAGAKLVVILGHSGCGFVESACAHLEMGALTPLLSKVLPAVQAERRERRGAYEDQAFVDAAARRHARLQLHQLLDRSPVLQDLFDAGQIGLASAFHAVETGAVEFTEVLMPAPLRVGAGASKDGWVPGSRARRG